MAELQQTTNLIIIALGVYGVSTLIADYDGPHSIFIKLRKKFSAGLFECNVCLSVYIALVPLMFSHVSIKEYFAIIGLNIILSRAI